MNTASLRKKLLDGIKERLVRAEEAIQQADKEIKEALVLLQSVTDDPTEEDNE